MHSLRPLIDLCEDQQPMKPTHVSGTPHPRAAVDALERALKSAHSRGVQFNYERIDRIMQRICHHYNITGDQLHNLFVNRHHQVPDLWVKQL
jgi:hypothetical protein